MATANSGTATRETSKAEPGRVLLIGRDTGMGTALEENLRAHDCSFEYAVGSADALHRLRRSPYDVVVTDPVTGIEEDLALVSEIRGIRPGVRVIVLAPHSNPEEIIGALRARVFVCKVAPFDPVEIAECAARAASAVDAPIGIEVVSAHPNWVSVRMNCQLLNAERLIEFFKELRTELEDASRDELMMAFREILMNAIEHGAGFHPAKVIDVAAVRTARAIVFYVHDPGSGFRWDHVEHAAVSNPQDDPTRHITVREAQGMRPGGFGILIARGVVNELIYSEVGNEVLLIKHIA